MTFRRRSFLIGLAIVGFWILMTGFFLRRELGGFFRFEPLSASRDDARRLEGPETMRLGLFRPGEAGGQEVQVGEVVLHREPESRGDTPGVRMELQARATMGFFGRATDLELAGTMWRPDEAPRADFDFTVRTSEADFHLVGRVADGMLRAEVTSAGDRFPLEIPVDEEMVFAGSLGPAFELPLLDVGESARLAAFDPLTLQKGEMRLRCLARETLEVAGETVPTRVLEASLGGFSSRVWIDEEGRLVQAETPVGLLLRRLVLDMSPAASPITAGDGKEASTP